MGVKLKNNMKKKKFRFGFKKREEPSLKTDKIESSSTERRWSTMTGNADIWGKEYSRDFTLQLLEEVLLSIAKEEQRFFIGKRCLIDIETNHDEDIFDDKDLECGSETGKAWKECLNRLCLVAGSPNFDQNVSKELQNVGFEEKGIITFQFCS